MHNSGVETRRTAKALTFVAALAASMLAALAISFGGQNASKAYAATSDVEYIAVLGIDFWNPNNLHHLEGSDLQYIARVDKKKGSISLLTIPRDVRYNNNKKLDSSAKRISANYAFHYGFYKVINSSWSNYDEAVAAGAEATCKMMKDFTGIDVTKYAAVDLHTYQTLIDQLGGVTVDIPVGIKNYRLYSNGKYYSVNKGKTGNAKLNAFNAMVASRSRQTYGMKDLKTKKTTHKYAKKSAYKGDYPQLLMKIKSGSKTYYAFDQDGVRQFLNRRTLSNLIAKGLTKGEGTADFVWSALIATGTIKSNITQEDVAELANAFVANKDNITMMGASMVTPSGSTIKAAGLEQFLITPKSSQIKNAVKQFKAGKLVTKGWGAEYTHGLAKGKTSVVKKSTYKVASTSAVSVKTAANKKSVSIPAAVTVNNKSYKVTATAAKSFKGTKIRKVTLGANITKIAKNTFKSSKATTLIIKSKNLTKASVKGALKGSKIKTVKISISGDDAAEIKAAYKTYFAKGNSGKKVSVK